MTINLAGNKTFTSRLKEQGISIKRNQISTLQVNIGKKCNQACHHCHVEAGPNRTENMTRATIEQLLLLIKNSPQVTTIDITGGAPELNQNFRFFVQSLRKLNKKVLDRCNLTVLFESGQEDTAEFLATNQVEIVASLPCYLEENVDTQRGNGVFQKSIQALKLLNNLGYGRKNSGLVLNLVYNPITATLPPAQGTLEADYKKYLKANYDIEFTNLFTITNMPIKRYAHMLKRDGKMQSYMQLLIDNFNPSTVDNLMCKYLVSVGWDGKLYDCDFNQMLDIEIAQPNNIWNIANFQDLNNNVVLGNHCFGCTAGSGSSCSGATT